MITLTEDLLDTNEGLDALRSAGLAADFCIDALRALTDAYRDGKIMRAALLEIHTQADDWAFWCFEQLYGVCDQGMRMFFLQLAVTDNAGTACHMDINMDLTEIERTYLRGIWHSEYRVDGASPFPAYETVIREREGEA